MGWKPAEFYAETVADIQIALAAHYDRVEYEATQLITLHRRLTYFIVNTGGYVKREIAESEIIELPHERMRREREKRENQFSDDEIRARLERWNREGPGIRGGQDATKALLMLAK